MLVLQVELEKGKTVSINAVAKSNLTKTGEREVFFEVNGQMRSVIVKDKEATKVSRCSTIGELYSTVLQCYSASVDVLIVSTHG